MARRRSARRTSPSGWLVICQSRCLCYLLLAGLIAVLWISDAVCIFGGCYFSPRDREMAKSYIVRPEEFKKYAARKQREWPDFIYVYELPAKFNKDMRKQHPAWHDPQYEAERMFHEWLEEGSVGHKFRTYDPDRATLFYLPIYTSFFINLVCGEDHKAKMVEAVQAASALVEEAIRLVRQQYPFWNASAGTDHFVTATYDHGRCSCMTYVPFDLSRNMFTLQMNGDWHVRTVDSVGSDGLRVLSFNGGLKRLNSPPFPDIACYRQGHDVVIPPLALENMIDPSKGNRSILLLGSFGRSVLTKGGLDKPVRHHNHAVREELWDIYKKKKPQGWLFETKIDIETQKDMLKAKFCACPPGNSQWTSRMVKSILNGCIPVTFFKAHDQPWQDMVDYKEFSFNLDPDNVTLLEDRLKKLAADDKKVRAMQATLRKYQILFSYDYRLLNGSLGFTIEALWKRSKWGIEHGFLDIGRRLM